jgi:hypothetical protein
MSVYIFVGPTLPVAEARAELDAVYLPPVAQGDVYRAARAGARAIGIIDGFFERLPAVWHKEILWAMAEGVHVFGSASMGALRAAELAVFGMVGIGPIYDAFASGELEDDDEVAVAHGPADAGYQAGSEAMVDIRATLASAQRQGIVSESTRAALERLAKGLFYPERSWPTLLHQGASASLPEAELAPLQGWLRDGRISQKRLDALAMLRHMREFLAGDPPRKTVRYTFERTVWWEKAAATAGELHAAGQAESQAVLLAALVEEAQLAGEYERLRDAALLRHLAVGHAQQASAALSPDYQQAVADQYRRRHGLLRSADVERWLEVNHLSRDRFAELLREEALAKWSATRLSGEVSRRLADELRLQNRYADLLARARHKQHMLAQSGWHNPSLEELGLAEGDLLAWHFGRLGQPQPADVEQYAEQAGFDDSGALLRALLREWCYLRSMGQEVSGATASPAR